MNCVIHKSHNKLATMYLFVFVSLFACGNEDEPMVPLSNLQSNTKSGDPIKTTESIEYSASDVSFPAAGNAQIAAGFGGIGNKGAYQLYYDNGMNSEDLPNIWLIDNLNEGGEGSFIQAWKASTPRIIIPRVSGYIDHNKATFTLGDHVTFAGQTSPNGIHFTGHSLACNASYAILRFFKASGDHEGHDGLTLQSLGSSNTKMIADHVTAYRSKDEQITIMGNPRGPEATTDVTIQWCMLFEGNKVRYGSLIKYNYSNHLSILNNFYAHNVQRSPQLGLVEDVDVMGNIIYNPSARGLTINIDTRRVNIVGNYFKQGPSTRVLRMIVISQNGPHPNWYTNQIYLHGNYHSESRRSNLLSHNTDWSIMNTSGYQTMTQSVQPNDTLPSQVPPNTEPEAEQAFRKGTWSGGSYGQGTWSKDEKEWENHSGLDYELDPLMHHLDVRDYSGDFLHHSNVERRIISEFNSGTGEVPTSEIHYPDVSTWPEIINTNYTSNSWGIPNSWLTVNGYLTGDSEQYYVDPANANNHPWGGIVQEFIDDIAWIEANGTD